MDNLGKNSGELGKTFPRSLYIHVPFCAYRCRYCDFYFETTQSPKVHQQFVDRLLSTAREARESWGEAPLDTLSLGGGTPSVLSAPLLSQLYTGLKEIFGPIVQESSIEVNPDQVTPELLEVLQAGGVNRLSLGVQTLDDQVLRELGRRAWRETTEGALDLVSRSWKGSWSLDLMTGLPGHSSQTLEKDVEDLLAYQPGHVSLYALTLEPGTPLQEMVKRRQTVLPSQESADGLWLEAKDELVRRGFQWYEISNFAKPGERSLHNQAYWRLDPYLGLGPGAQGLVWDRDSDRPVHTLQPKLFPWLGGEGPEIEVLSDSSFFLEHLLTGLRTSDGLSWNRVEQRFHRDLRSVWKDLWPRLEDRGWVDSGGLQGAAFRLTDPGRLVLDRVLEELLPWVDRLSLA